MSQATSRRAKVLFALLLLLMQDHSISDPTSAIYLWMHSFFCVPPLWDQGCSTLQPCPYSRKNPVSVRLWCWVHGAEQTLCHRKSHPGEPGLGDGSWLPAEWVQCFCIQKTSNTPLAFTQSPVTQDLAAPQRWAVVWKSKIFFIPEHFHYTHWVSLIVFRKQNKATRTVQKWWEKTLSSIWHIYFTIARGWLYHCSLECEFPSL